MHLFADISGHGYGHLAIAAPVLAVLRKIAPNWQLTVRSPLPEAKLRERLPGDFALIPEASDFGYLMHDATHLDLPASAERYRAAHADWTGRVARESALLEALQPDLVLSNVSYLPLAGAALAGIPAAAICSLNWADLFRHNYGEEAWAQPIHREMLAAYRSAALFLRVTPGMPMPELPNLRPIGPVAARGRRHDLGLGGDKAVLIAMGGIPHRIPVDNWPRLPGVRWLVSAEWQCTHPDALPYESFGLSFTELLCSVDAVIGKPGYGMFTEAACNGVPLLYQLRDNWPEQDALIDWLHRHGRAGEVPAGMLQDGVGLQAALAALWAQTPPPLPPADGPAEAARLLLGLAGANAQKR